MAGALDAFMLGAIAMASAVASLFFVRFWRQTRDRFFLFFALSFAVAALDRIVLALDREALEDQPIFYVIRLLMHALIVVAILDKNRGGRRP
jgi:hypothetical protein